MKNTNKDEIVKAGWVFGNFDGFVGERIYPSWQGALEGKRLVLRDVRVLKGVFFIHNPWKPADPVDRVFESLKDVEAYIIQNGRVLEQGANVWD